MRHLNKGDPNRSPGMWKRWQGPGGKVSAIISCPHCGGIGVLTDHHIDLAGGVTPSVQCPDKDCGWHEYVKLMNWAESLRP